MAERKSMISKERLHKVNRRNFDTWDTFTAMAKAGVSLPLLFTPQLVSLGSELTRIISGKSEIEPGKDDNRFEDPTWSNNPIYKSSMQTYLAWCQHLQELFDETDLSEQDKVQAKVAVKLLTDSLSPSHPATNLDAVRRAVKARGASLVHGLNRMTSDVLELYELPQSNAKVSLKLGKDIAATPGTVVFRNDQLELIQYRATTAKVQKEPVLLIPSPINKFYIFDLYPHNSLTHYLVEAGFQVFSVSFRNPNNQHKSWNLETYITALAEATEAITSISNYPKLNLLGYSAGGIFAALLSSLLTTHKKIKTNTASFAVTNFTTHTDTQVGIPINSQMINAAKTLLKYRNILDGKELAQMFAWLRPNSMLWNAWICNYFAGEDQPSADVCYWNNDTPRVANALFSDFLDLYQDDSLLEPNKMKLGGEPVDLTKISCDKYIVSGSNDHITPWEFCYQSSLNLGENREFVLVNRGHMRTLACPEGSKAARFYTNKYAYKNYNDWLSEATQHNGSWWSHWADWLKQRSEGTVKAPPSTGNKHFPPLTQAPGNYILE